MIHADTPKRGIKRIRKDLLKYCGQDTLAMVLLTERLKN